MTREDQRRRALDTRPTVSLSAAVEAANMIAAIERETVALRAQWEKCFPKAASALPNASKVMTDNGAHIGNFYAAKGKR